VVLVNKSLSLDEAITEAMNNIMLLLKRNGMLCPEQLAIPWSFQTHLWLRLRFLRTHERVATTLEQVATLNTNLQHHQQQLPRTELQESLSTASLAVEKFKSGEFHTALTLIELSLQQLEAVLSDPTTSLPPLDFPPDHLLAVFAPLLLPLIIPLGARVFHEVKRYRKLIA